VSGQNVFAKWLLKPSVFTLSLVPLALLVLAVAQNRYANPVEAILQGSGEWALRFLLLTLFVTPLQFLFKWLWVARLRRMLGLFAFFYVSLHLLIWLGLDLEFSLSAAIAALVEKPFITMGMVAFAGLVPLALTSNRFSVRRLGTRWKVWHSAVYLLTVLAIVHLVWQVKGSDLLEPAIYLLVLIALYLWRFARLIR
jgi:sulfoxide reductase heme-binding subunit YedZ